MTYAPADLLAVADYLVAHLDLAPGVARAVDLERGEIGIVGDPKHAVSGGYHEGVDDLRRVGRLTTDYSRRESVRDLVSSDAASALDIGDFDVTVNGRQITLRSLSTAIAEACRAGDPRTRDIREIIYSPDGNAVRRFDRIGVRSGGDASHRWHTHVSFFRDSEGRRNAADNFGGLLQEIIEGIGGRVDMDFNQAQKLDGIFNLFPTVKLDTDATPDGKGTLKDFPVPLTAAVKALAADVGALKAAPAADAGQLAAALAGNEAFVATLAAAVASHVNQQAGATPEQVRAIVDEQLDQAMRGGADND